MNILLKKILINLSILVFVATFFISLHVGTPLIECFLRGSISALVLAVIGRFVLVNFFKDLAIQIAKHDRQKEQKENQQKSQEESVDDYDHFYDDDKKEQNSTTGTITDNPFADHVAQEPEHEEQDII